MENPSTWTKAEHVVANVIENQEWLKQQSVYGLSLPRMICDALRREDLLRDDGWEVARGGPVRH